MSLLALLKGLRENRSIPNPTFPLQLDLTHACNLRCRHCYQDKSHLSDTALSLSAWKDILQQYFLFASKLSVTPALIVSGGEPLVSPHWRDIVTFSRATEPNASVLLLTNGTLITESVAQFLGDHGVHVQVSLDGPVRELHDHFRGDGSYDRTMAGLEWLDAAGVPFFLQAVLQKLTAGAIPLFFREAESRGATEMNFVRLVPNAPAQRQEMLSGKPLKEAYELILHSSREQRVATDTSQPLWCLLEEGLGHPCSAGFLGLTIDPQGMVHLTSRILHPIGQATARGGIEKAFFDHPLSKALRAGKIKGCDRCQYFARCRGDRNVSFVLHGDFLGPDEHCWHWQEHMRTS